MSTGRKRSLSGPACSSPAKRKKYLCKYQKAWEAEINWLSHGDRSVNDANCILCKSHLSIGSGAKNDLTRHAKSQTICRDFRSRDFYRDIAIQLLKKLNG